MRPDLPPEIVDEIQRRHAADLARIRALYAGRSAAPARSQHDDIESLGIVCWVVLIVVASALLGLYGPGVSHFAWSLLK